jgi:hypothetical protein
MVDGQVLGLQDLHQKLFQSRIVSCSETSSEGWWRLTIWSFAAFQRILAGMMGKRVLLGGEEF